MNEKIKQLAVQAGMVEYPTGINIKENTLWGDRNINQFAQLIVEHILTKIDSEIELAYEQEQEWTAATLQALALEILEDFDMEIDMDDGWDAEAELEKLVDEFKNEEFKGNKNV